MRAALLLLLFCTACPTLEEQSHISKLRVLGVRADPAELILQPDAGLPATTLTALAVTPAGEAQSVKFALCTQITGVPDPTLDCPGDAGIDLPAQGALAARLDLSDPRILAFAAAAQSDAGLFDAGGLADALDQGVPLLVGFTAADGTQSMSGFETLTLRSAAHGPANVNPEMTDLEIGDGGDVHTGEVILLQPIATAKDDATKRYLYSFFATAGSIDSLHTTDTTSTGQSEPTSVQWTAPDAPQQVRLWVVLRDGRGGTAWLEKDVQVH